MGKKELVQTAVANRLKVKAVTLAESARSGCARIAKVPEIERLRWLDELVRFTLMFRKARIKKNIDLEQPEPNEEWT